MQTHTLSIRWVLRNALAIIFYQQFAPALFGRQLNQNFSWLTMLDRIIHCFLGNVVKMRGHRVIMNQDRRFTLKAA